MARPDIDTRALPAETRKAVSAVRILNTAQLVGMQFDVVNIIEAHSCKRMMTDPPASRTNAIEQLKYKAVEAGADAISNVQCGGREPTSANMNCWESISCTAEAIKIAKP